MFGLRIATANSASAITAISMLGMASASMRLISRTATISRMIGVIVAPASMIVSWRRGMLIVLVASILCVRRGWRRVLTTLVSCIVATCLQIPQIVVLVGMIVALILLAWMASASSE